MNTLDMDAGSWAFVLAGVLEECSGIPCPHARHRRPLLLSVPEDLGHILQIIEGLARIRTAIQNVNRYATRPHA